VTGARVASDASASTPSSVLDVDLRVSVPAGWRGAARRATVLDPRGFATVPLEIAPARHAAAGHHVVRVDAVATAGGIEIAHAYDQQFLSVGVDGTPVELVGDVGDVVVARGAASGSSFALVNRTAVELVADVDIVGPWDSWPAITAGRWQVTLAAGERTDVPVAFAPPAGMAPGTWWWLPRVAVGQLVLYGDSARLRVTD
jgi:hypothetical protein